MKTKINDPLPISFVTSIIIVLALWNLCKNPLQLLHLVCIEMCFYYCKKRLPLDKEIYCRFSFCKCKSYCVVYKIRFIVYSVLECSQCKFGFKEEFMRKMSILRGRFGKWKMSSMNSINLTLQNTNTKI